VPRNIWGQLSSQSEPFSSALSIFYISLYIIIASQLVGNVAVVIILADQIVLLEKETQIFAWVLLAFISTGKYVHVCVYV
jgi:hypothetical protein